MYCHRIGRLQLHQLGKIILRFPVIEDDGQHFRCRVDFPDGAHVSVEDAVAHGTAVGTGIFNGDVGTITCIDTQQETVTVVFDEREADYDFTQLNELEPAYAMTVHKSQGSGATRSLVKS